MMWLRHACRHIVDTCVRAEMCTDKKNINKKTQNTKYCMYTDMNKLFTYKNEQKYTAPSVRASSPITLLTGPLTIYLLRSDEMRSFQLSMAVYANPSALCAT